MREATLGEELLDNDSVAAALYFRIREEGSWWAMLCRYRVLEGLRAVRWLRCGGLGEEWGGHGWWWLLEAACLLSKEAGTYRSIIESLEESMHALWRSQDTLCDVEAAG